MIPPEKSSFSPILCFKVGHPPLSTATDATASRCGAIPAAPSRSRGAARPSSPLHRRHTTPPIRGQWTRTGGNLHAFDLVFCRYPLGGVLNGSIKRLRYPIGTLTSWRVSQWFNRSRRQRSFSRETPAFLTDLFGEHLDLSWCFKYSGIDESCCLGVGKYHAARFLSKRNKKL